MKVLSEALNKEVQMKKSINLEKSLTCLILFILITSEIYSQPTISAPVELVESGGRTAVVVKGIEIQNMKLNLIFDTGAAGSGIDQKTLTELNLIPDRYAAARGAGGEIQVPLFSSRNVVIGKKSFQMDLALFPLAPVILKDGSVTSGILGLGSLTDYYVELNMDKMCLIISETPIHVADEKNSVTLTTASSNGVRFIEGNLITAEGNIITGPMYFDTGNSSPLIINQSFIKEYDFLKEKDKLEKFTLSGVGSQLINAYRISLPGLIFDSISLNDIPALVKEPGSVEHREDIANIGLPILKKFNIIFDKDQSKIILEKSKYFDEVIAPIKSQLASDDKTPTSELFQAVKEGDLEKLKNLWKANPSFTKVTPLNPGGNTLLHVAVFADKTDIAKFLIEQKVDLNVKNTGNGAAPLHLAVYKKNYEVIKLLLAAGADKNMRDGGGMTPYQMAKMFGDNQAMELLK